MADNAFIKIGTALLKHQVKKLVGEEAMDAIGAELADIGGDKLDAWLGDQSTIAEIEKAATTARENFHGKVNDDEVEQWMVMLPIHDLPPVLSAIEELPTSPDETKLESALRESIALNWKRLSPTQADHAVNAFMSCLRSALLPIEKQTLMIIGREVLKTGEKVDQLLKLVENLQAIKPDTSHLTPDTPKGWFYGHRYGDLETFTGRVAELDMLNAWLNNDKDNLLMIRALGGFGKSALAWTWFNRVDREQWQTAVWWSFYEKESGFESFLAETLKHLGVEVKESARQQVNDLLEAMRGTNILIVLDGFERLLRQYGRMDAALVSDDEDADIDPSQRDCSSPLTETFLRGLSGAGMRSKVLMTTRLCPRALESADGKLLKGCRDEALSAFSPEDAVTYFRNEGIKARRDEIIEVCSAYGYHPLSLSLLVGLINEDHEKRGDIEAVKNLEIFEDVRARRHHVLERAYESLPPERRDLLSKMSCFRGSMEYAVLKKVFPSPDLDKALLDLRKRGLLQYAGETQRYDMHPVVRHYAYAHLTDTERISTHKLLIDYFEALPIPKKVERIEDLDPVIEQYFHTVRAGMFDKALNIFANHLSDSLYFHFGVYTTIIQLLRELFRNDKETASLLLLEDNCAWASSVIATSYCLSGQPRRAIPFFKVHNKSRKKFHRVRDYAVGLENMALVAQILIGDLRRAEKNLFASIELRKDLPNQKIWMGVSYRELGRIMLYRGLWDDAKQNLDISYKLFSKGKLTQSKSAVQAYRALRILMKYRDNIPSKKHYTLAIRYAKSSLEIAEEMESPFPRDLIFANLVLGSTYLLSNQIGFAEDHLVEALKRCRVIGLVEMEASILLELARLRYVQGDFKDAQEKASEALVITERSGYVLQGADVNLFFAQYALEQEKDKAKARQYAEEAKKLATCDGPPYYYKVAYEEAERILERMKAEG